jgi:hypothetical protein
LGTLPTAWRPGDLTRWPELSQRQIADHAGAWSARRRAQDGDANASRIRPNSVSFASPAATTTRRRPATCFSHRTERTLSRRRQSHSQRRSSFSRKSSRLCQPLTLARWRCDGLSAHLSHHCETATSICVVVLAPVCPHQRYGDLTERLTVYLFGPVDTIAI